MLHQNERERFHCVITELLRVQSKKTGAGLFNAPSEGRFPDPADWASAEAIRDLGLRIMEREKDLIGQLLGALRRLDTGAYGICEECEEEIELGRLEAHPATTLCLECQREQESEEKRRAHR
jgi:RNA polymerase-binding protein DksA